MWLRQSHICESYLPPLVHLDLQSLVGQWLSVPFLHAAPDSAGIPSPQLRRHLAAIRMCFRTDIELLGSQLLGRES